MEETGQDLLNKAKGELFLRKKSQLEGNIGHFIRRISITEKELAFLKDQLDSCLKTNIEDVELIGDRVERLFKLPKA